MNAYMTGALGFDIIYNTCIAPKVKVQHLCSNILQYNTYTLQKDYVATSSHCDAPFTEPDFLYFVLQTLHREIQVINSFL